MSVPTKELPETFEVTERLVIGLARAIASDLYNIQDILRVFKLSNDAYERIRSTPMFKTYLDAELVAWADSSNAQERVKIKATIMLEEWLPEFCIDLTDRGSPLASRVKGAELLAKLAGLGDVKGPDLGVGEKFSITINMGQSSPKTIEGSVLPAQVSGD